MRANARICASPSVKPGITTCRTHSGTSQLLCHRQKIQRMGQAAARMGAVSLFGAELQVRQHQVRMRQHLPRGGKSTRAGGIQRRVVALRPQRLQQRRSEHGWASGSPPVTVTPPDS